MLAVFDLYYHVCIIASTMTSTMLFGEPRLALHLPSLCCYQHIAVVASLHFVYHECLKTWQ